MVGAAHALSGARDSLLLAGQLPAPASEEPEIRKAFAEYRSALLKKDGGAAARAVDSDTLAYYGRIAVLTLEGDSASVKQLTLLDRLMVLRLRLQVDPEALKKMGGRELFAYSVDQGWVSASSVEKAELGKVKISGTEAKGEFINGGKLTPLSFVFKKEQRWRFSLLPLLLIGEPAMKQMAKQTGQEENAFIFSLLEKVTGKPVPESTWEPLVAAPKARP